MDVNTLQNGDKDCRHLTSSKSTMSKPAYRRYKGGFSLLELISTLTIIAIVGSMIPSVAAALIHSNKITSAVNAIASSMSYARSEAIIRSQDVEICKSEDGINCTNLNQWESGWLIFVDNNKNRQRDAVEQRLKYQPPINTINITYKGSGSSNYIRFRPDGATGVNGTFAFCSDIGGIYKKALILFRTGRLRLSETRTKGIAISCSNFRS